MTNMPMLAETFADGVNWSLIFTGIMSVATLALWWDSRKQHNTIVTPQPLSVTGTPMTNAELVRDFKAMNHRLVDLENWRLQLVNKMDADKAEVIAAGEQRAAKIYEHMNEVRLELDGKISAMPSEIVALLRNTGNLK